MAIALFFSPAAIKALRAMPKADAHRLMDRLETIAAAPEERSLSVTAMPGEPAGRFRIRQGDWQAVYER